MTEHADFLYIHIPFCKHKCPYCAFYSVPHEKPLASSYIDTISRQLIALNLKFRTIYIGGGTPTVLGLEPLEALLNPLQKYMGSACEFTIEANPESLSADKLSLFLDKGVNRISIGGQSFNDDKLKMLGRIHNASVSKKAVESAAKYFKNISIDMIFGVFGEDLDAWKNDLKAAVHLPVTHISCYSLMYEKNTPFMRSVNEGAIIPLEDEKSADMFEYAISRLSGSGFSQYEISNFSKGHAFVCRHNLNYWENNPYIGLGASAVSYTSGIREENISDIAGYMEKVERREPVAVSSEELNPKERAKETAALKIRTMEGISFKWFKEKTGFEFIDLEKETLSRLLEEGLVEYFGQEDRPEGLRLTHKGLLFCDIVSGSFV